MTRLRMLTLLVVVAHWIVAIWHLFLAANVLPAPNHSVSWLAIVLLTLLHWGVSIALWKVSDNLVSLVLLIFFLSALSANLYEHFLHASLNNVFVVTPSDWTTWFSGSVFILLVLEIVGCTLGVRSLRGRTKKSAVPTNTNHSRQGPGGLSSSQFRSLPQAGS